jgi:hypothetical protein
MSVVLRSEANFSGRLPKIRPIDWTVYEEMARQLLSVIQEAR